MVNSELVYDLESAEGYEIPVERLYRFLDDVDRDDGEPGGAVVLGLAHGERLRVGERIAPPERVGPAEPDRDDTSDDEPAAGPRRDRSLADAGPARHDYHRDRHRVGAG